MLQYLTPYITFFFAGQHNGYLISRRLLAVLGEHNVIP